jgi:hypothetical protein
MTDWAELDLDPEGATVRVADDMGRDWVKDVIFRSDVLQELKDRPERVVNRLEEGALPRRGSPIPVPKSSVAMRPAIDLRLIDRVAYQTLTDLFAWEELAELPPFVSGWRFLDDPSGPGDLADNGREWRQYQLSLEEQVATGAKWVLVTDIAGFFQSIPHLLLRERLLRIPSLVKEALFRHLEIWSPWRIGLPQRFLASSLLANAYLEPLDAVLKDYRALRWMDDIVVFCDSRRQGVEAIIRIQETLHPLNLQINAGKTHLVPEDEAENLVIDWRLRSIEYQLDAGTPGSRFFEEGRKALFRVWNDVMRKPDNADRTKFSFCVTRFDEQGWGDPAFDNVLPALPQLPHVSDHVSRYLRGFAESEEQEILDRVSRFLRGKNNQYPWQEHHLAALYWHARSLSQDHLDAIRARAASERVLWAARNVYFRALARHGIREDARELARRAETTGSPEILRGLVIAGFESGELSNRLLAQMVRDSEELRGLLAFLRNRGSPPPLSF